MMLNIQLKDEKERLKEDFDTLPNISWSSSNSEAETRILQSKNAEAGMHKTEKHEYTSKLYFSKALEYMY